MLSKQVIKFVNCSKQPLSVMTIDPSRNRKTVVLVLPGKEFSTVKITSHIDNLLKKGLIRQVKEA